MERITYAAAMVRTKKAVASKKKDLEWSDILAAMKLADPPLRFTDVGKGTLSAPINTQFEEYAIFVSPTEARKTTYVRDLTKIAWDKIPQKWKVP